MRMPRAALMKALKKNYPKMWLKKSEDLNGRKGGIWTGEGSEDENGIDLFNYYSAHLDPNEKIYRLMVRVSLANFREKAGWFAECQDPGTWILWPM